MPVQAIDANVAMIVSFDFTDRCELPEREEEKASTSTSSVKR